MSATMVTPIEQVGQRARLAAQEIAVTSAEVRDSILHDIAHALQQSSDFITSENAKDLQAAAAAKSDVSLVKRLVLSKSKIDGLIAGLQSLRALPDPLGVTQMDRSLSPDLRLQRRACPLGVLCIIFESRPEAIVQISSLAIKSGNAIILKGGKEAAKSNAALVDLIRGVLAKSGSGFPADAVQYVSSREEVAELLQLDSYVDLVIPRGGNALVRSVKAATRIPVLGHADGICHVYLDAAGRREVAVPVIVDSKTNYPAACNSAETLLVHVDALHSLLPHCARALINAGVTLHADATCMPVLLDVLSETKAAAAAEQSLGDVEAMVDGDEETEWLSLHMTVVAVNGVQEAVRWINEHGSHHTDCIVTEDASAASAFTAGVDSAGVYHNASTRFADGYRYGFGAEVGISTNRLHARGPVGLEGLLTYKYTLVSAPGTTHTVAQFSAVPGEKTVIVGGCSLPALEFRHHDFITLRPEVQPGYLYENL